jgi:hypothetical protein
LKRSSAVVTDKAEEHQRLIVNQFTKQAMKIWA